MLDDEKDYDVHEDTNNGKARDSDHTPNSSAIKFRDDSGPMSGKFNLKRERKYAKDYYERHKDD